LSSSSPLFYNLFPNYRLDRRELDIMYDT